jgi:ABC-type sugar transport system ATPase subunit
LGLSHRVLVMRNGRLVTDLAGTERTAERVLSAALTESASDRSEARE